MDTPKAKRPSFGKALLIWSGFFALPLFIAAGCLDWWNAWAFLIVNLLSITFVNEVVYKKTPDLAQERETAGANTKRYDQVIVPLTVALLPMAGNITAGLDQRFGWTNSITTTDSLIALAIYIVSVLLIAWSMMANRFFSSHFHIQKERGHTVASHGPYALIRHPGYLAMVLGSLALPVLLGSMPALAIGAVSACLGIVRTALEDRALQAELPGYREYTEKVRYRLVPLVW